MLAFFLAFFFIILSFLQISIVGAVFSSPFLLNLLLFLSLSWLLLFDFKLAIWLGFFSGFLLGLWLNTNSGIIILAFISAIILVELSFLVFFNKRDVYSAIWVGVLGSFVFNFWIFLFFGKNFQNFLLYFLINAAMFPIFFYAVKYLNNHFLFIFRKL